MLSEKAAKIVALLLNNDKSPITARQISAILEISERSVSTYLKEVYSFCAERNIEVSNKPGTGIIVRAGTKKEGLMRELKLAGKPYYTAEYRINYIMSLLLNNWTTYTTSLFADDLCVSKNTIDSDLLQAEERLAAFSVRIVKKAGLGIALSGAETDLRRAIVSINRRFYKPFTGKLPAVTDYRLTEETYRRLCGAYRGVDVGFYVDFIKTVNRKGQRPLTDIGFESMLEYVMVAHTRSRAGHTVEKDVWRNNPHDRYRIDEYMQLFKEGLALSDDELAYYELLVCCMEYQPSRERMEELFTDPLLDVLSFTKELIRYLGLIIGLDFTKDRLLLKTLYYYNRSALPRVEYGIEMPNPFLEEVKKTYPAVFSASFAAGSLYCKKTGKNPSENELSSLSLLIGGAIVRSDKKIKAVVICASGFGTSEIVARKIVDKVPQIQILGTLSYSELGKLAELAPQLVISTVANVQTKLPVVYISPVLSDDDVKKLNRAAAAVYTKADAADEPGDILSLLSEELITLDFPATSKEKVLRTLCDKLAFLGCVTDSYYADVISREQMGCTALGRGVAIPHGMAGGVLKPAICLARLQKSMDWSGEPADLIFLLALNFDDINSTRQFFKSFYKLWGSDTAINQLRSAKSAAQVREIIKEQLE